jgi:phenylacetate-CoA ligase
MVRATLACAGLRPVAKSSRRAAPAQPDVVWRRARYTENYGMTETWPFGGQLCERGHLHFEPVQGLLEIVAPDTGEPTAPGEIGTIVATPFPPFRDTTLLLRYNTEDMVRR